MLEVCSLTEALEKDVLMFTESHFVEIIYTVNYILV